VWQPLIDLLRELEPRPWWQALKVLAATVVLAFLLRWLLDRVVTRITARTRTSYDDRITLYLKAPVTISVVLFGFNLALVLLDLGDPYYRYALSVVKTAAILVWVIFFGRLARLHRLRGPECDRLASRRVRLRLAVRNRTSVTPRRSSPRAGRR